MRLADQTPSQEPIVDWIQLVSAVGVGALLTKILDAIWLNRVAEQSTQRAWLRDNRLKAFQEAASELLAFGLDRKSPDDPFATYARLARAMIICKDNKIALRLDQFVVKRDRMFHDNSKKEESDKLCGELVSEARDIVDLLRLSIVDN